MALINTAHKIRVKSLKESVNSEDVNIDSKKILKWMQKSVDWTDVVSGHGTVARSCERGS